VIYGCGWRRAVRSFGMRFIRLCRTVRQPDAIRRGCCLHLGRYNKAGPAGLKMPPSFARNLARLWCVHCWHWHREGGNARQFPARTGAGPPTPSVSVRVAMLQCKPRGKMLVTTIASVHWPSAIARNGHRPYRPQRFRSADMFRLCTAGRLAGRLTAPLFSPCGGLISFQVRSCLVSARSESLGVVAFVSLQLRLAKAR